MNLEENKKIVHDTDKWNTSNNSSFDRSSKLSNFFIKYSGGLIKNKEQANIAMIVVAILFFVITIFMFFNLSKSVTPPTQEEVNEFPIS